MTELKIDPEFRDKIPPLTDAEFKQLEENILNDGEVYEPIAVWNGTIVDGHNRWKIVQAHPGIPYRLKQMHFKDKWAAFDWMYKKQLGRRNLTTEQRTYLIGKMYEARKNSQGGDRRSEEFSNGQNVHLKTTKETKAGTAGEIGREFGMDGRSVRRAEKFASGIETLRSVSREAAEKVLSGGAGVTKTTVIELPKAPKEKVEQIATQIESGSVVDPIRGTEHKDGRSKELSGKLESRNNLAKIKEVSEILARNRGNEYTADDALEELKVIEREFVGKVRRVFEVRKDVISADDRFEKLLIKFAKEIENLKGELP